MQVDRSARKFHFEILFAALIRSKFKAFIFTLLLITNFSPINNSENYTFERRKRLSPNPSAKFDDTIKITFPTFM